MFVPSTVPLASVRYGNCAVFFNNLEKLGEKDEKLGENGCRVGRKMYLCRKRRTYYADGTRKIGVPL